MYLDKDQVGVLNEYQRQTNAVGLSVSFQCGQMIKGSVCMGEVTRRKGGYLKCRKCNRVWERRSKLLT